MIDSGFIYQYDTFISFCILRYTKPPIDDYKQDIYLILLEHEFHNGNLKGYISKIVQNYFYDKFRRKKDIKNSLLNVTNPAESHLLLKDVLHTLNNLPGGKCLRLYSIGYKYHEIADILSIKMSSVKSNIYRVRKRLNANK